MKNRYIPPELKVVTFAVRSNILESSYIGLGDGVIEARKNTFGFWDSESDNESEELESLY